MLCLCSKSYSATYKQRGLEYSGSLGEGFVNLRATIDIKQAVQDAQIILIVTPSPFHETYTRILAPLLTRKEIPIALSGSSTDGDLHSYKILKDMRVSEPIIENSKSNQRW
ncbi:MAG TPA: hypothetical protein VFR94_23450 [Nitrososphaeraceae archaeon]|nr:hypothetical protein [Nitrososphaeraceae archaeon]